jgi:hypothetical protein
LNRPKLDLQKVALYLSLANLAFSTYEHLRVQYQRSAAQAKQARNKRRVPLGFAPGDK